MVHQEYRHIVPGAHTAVLFIHGILGTPNHFSQFLPLVPLEWSVQNLLLDGHGAGVREFSRTSMARWQAQVEEAVAELEKTHAQILLVGHSMGTLLAIREAVRPGNQVAGLFLLACPLKLRLRLRMFTNSAKVYFGRIRPDDAPALAGLEACGIQHEWQFWRYFGWIPRFLELFRQIRATAPLLEKLEIPCFAYPSGQDEMVSLKACRLLEGKATVTILPDSSHFYYPPGDFETLLGEFSNFCKRY